MNTNSNSKVKVKFLFGKKRKWRTLRKNGKNFFDMEPAILFIRKEVGERVELKLVNSSGSTSEWDNF